MQHIAWLASATGFTGRASLAARRADGVATHGHMRPGSTTEVGAADGNAYMRAHGKVEATARARGLSDTIARPSFITGADHDASRPLQRVGAVVTEPALVLVGLVGGSRDRCRSTTNTVLAAALVDLTADPDAQDRASDSEGLRDRPCPKDQ
jgi:uncharacterized protein YbjT (DUF2867 family)